MALLLTALSWSAYLLSELVLLGRYLAGAALAVCALVNPGGTLVVLLVVYLYKYETFLVLGGAYLVREYFSPWTFQSVTYVQNSSLLSVYADL